MAISMGELISKDDSSGVCEDCCVLLLYLVDDGIFEIGQILRLL